MENNEKKEVTLEEAQTKAIDAMKNHPMWPAFREAYHKETDVYPEKTTVLALIPIYWRIFLAGAETRKEKWNE